MTQRKENNYMEKLNMHTQDMAEANIEKIGQLFPNCLTERIVGKDKDGKDIIGKAIDFDKLKQELSKEIVEGNQERYQFTWPGKREAMRLANTPTNMTLRPDRESSVDFDNTENLYIEGDNLEVLKLLRENYLGKVKMIYIDPPYNTGNDFVYEDDFSQTSGEFMDKSGMFDENGNMVLDKYSVNSESNGRFHTDWLNMMYPRLRIAKDLLDQDGVIFISIDDNEIENLRSLCDEIFGSNNFVAQFIWRGGRRNLAKYVSTSHEYMLCFGKNLSYISDNNISWKEKKKGLQEIYKKAEELVARTKGDYLKASQLLKDWYKTLPEDDESKANAHYQWIDKNGVYFASDISRGGGGGPKWDITNPTTGNVVQTPSRGWSYGKKEDLLRDIELGLIHFNGDGVPCKKRYLKENETQVLETVFYKDRRGSSKRLRSLMGGDYFPFPKDEEVIAHFIESFCSSDGLILDFFSGSSTTAHSVFINNSQDSGHRKFIMVQIPEKLEVSSEAYEAGYRTICDIAKDRIRKAGKAIRPTENGLFSLENTLDTGFRVLKLDTSNMQDVYYKPEDFSENTIFEDNVKPDRTSEDLLFQVMLECNLPLSAKIEKKTIAGKEVFNVNDGYLFACFDEDVNETVITEVAKQKPYYFIMRDKSLSSDNVADNFEQIFNAYSKDTIRKIL